MIGITFGLMIFTGLFMCVAFTNIKTGNGPWCLIVLFLMIIGLASLSTGLVITIEQSWQNFLVETGHAEYVSEKEPADRTPYDFKVFRMKGIK